MATIGSWLSCVGPIEAMILLTAGTITLYESQGGLISLRLAKILENLTLEQNGRSQGVLMASVGCWVSCMGPIEAMILLTAGTITL